MANLLARYTGDGLTAADVIDSIAGNNAANTGLSAAASPFATGGDALVFDTAGAGLPYVYAVVPAAVWDSSGIFAVSFYMKLDDPQLVTAFPYLLCEGVGMADLTAGFRLYSTTAFTSLIARLNNVSYTATLSIPLSTEHMVVVQRDASGLLEVFFNDMVTPVVSAPGTTWPGGADGLWLGKRPGYGGNYDGLLGDVRIYDGPLDQAEREALTTEPAPAAIVAPPWPVGCRWLVTLTGAADGLVDAALPASSLQARLRSGRDSYLSVVVPHTAALAEAVASRPNGDLQLVYRELLSDGTATDTAIVDVPVDLLQIPEGAQSASITLSGNRQSSNAAPASHTLARNQLTLRQTGTGAMVVRSPTYRPEIRPADDVTIGGAVLVIDTVNIQVSESLLTIEYSEAG